jgi:thioredoxin-related protein
MLAKRILLLFFIVFGIPFCLQAQEWQTDLNQAEKIAAEENKPIILVFQGSDWCAPCIKLDREIWTTDTFKKYSKDHFVMLKADFPRSDKNALEPAQQEKNNKLAETYNKEGYFPLVVVLNENGKVLGKTGYKHITSENYIKILNSFQQ